MATNKRFHVKKWLLFLITFAFVVTTTVCNEWKQKRRKGLKLLSHEESEHQVGGEGV
jgi:hypothetical protein